MKKTLINLANHFAGVIGCMAVCQENAIRCSHQAAPRSCRAICKPCIDSWFMPTPLAYGLSGPDQTGVLNCMLQPLSATQGKNCALRYTDSLSAFENDPRNTIAEFLCQSISVPHILNRLLPVKYGRTRPNCFGFVRVWPQSVQICISTGYFFLPSTSKSLL